MPGCLAFTTLNITWAEGGGERSEEKKERKEEETHRDLPPTLDSGSIRVANNTGRRRQGRGARIKSSQCQTYYQSLHPSFTFCLTCIWGPHCWATTFPANEMEEGGRILMSSF